jgi:hypothetical protein
VAVVAIDVAFVLAIVVLSMWTRRLLEASRIVALLAGLALALTAWGVLALLQLRPSVAALAVAAAIVVLWTLWRRTEPDTLKLRCAGCGNYFPSREHFATGQVCKRCAESGA